MAGHFAHLTNQLPDNISDKTSLYVAENIMLVKSRTYISGVEIYNSDYNFTFPVSSPPPTIIGNREYQFHKGRMIVFPPDHSITAKVSVPTKEYISLFFKKEYLQTVLAQMGSKKQLSFLYNEYSYAPKLRTIIRNLEEEMSRYAGDKCMLMQQSITTQIAVEVLRQTDAGDSVNHTEPKLQAHYIEDAVEYMNVHFNSNIRIEDICKCINLSPYYFIRIFRECMGQTPHEYLMKIRLAYAQKLLKAGNCSINEAARECGFVNTSHFSASFRQAYGVSPTGYQEKHI